MSNETFEIGLVGAGAISAGAYTGGVIDFMVQALDAWYAAKAADSGVAVQTAPPHDVKLSVFAGASAGGITAVLGAAYLAADQPPVTNAQQGNANNGKNTLFDSWVDRIDISGMLATTDLTDEQAPVVSLLDSSKLADIANTGLAVQPRASKRPYLSDNFELILTVTNLRGVPYAFNMMGDTPACYDMSLHADYMRFSLSDSATTPLPDRYTMRWNEFGTTSDLTAKLKLSALASGAFPVGLAPRLLDHVLPGSTSSTNNATDYYSARAWPVPTPDSAGPHQCQTEQCIPAHWGTVPANYRYQFLAVDGGVINNEPFELAHKVLAGAGCNPRDGALADRAVLLIDPFPSVPTFNADYVPPKDLLNTGMALFTALMNQARFKPDELVLAAHEDVYSRFMIAPCRDAQTYAIACGSLSGFGGFLKRDFRQHDFFLGRRNAQKFLKDHFVLPENNPLFTQWTAAMKDTHCVRDAAGAAVVKDGFRFLPIIPLVGTATAPCDALAWPSYTAGDLDHLGKHLDARVDLVLERLVHQYFKTNNFFIRAIAKFVLGRKRRELVAFIKDTITAELQRMKLMA